MGKLGSKLSEQLAEKQAEVERMKEEMDKLTQSSAQAEQDLLDAHEEFT